MCVRACMCWFEWVEEDVSKSEVQGQSSKQGNTHTNARCSNALHLQKNFLIPTLSLSDSLSLRILRNNFMSIQA